MLSLMSNTITNTYDSLARRVVESEDLGGDGQIDAQLQNVYGCTSLWEVIERIQLAAGLATSEQLLTTHVYGLGIDDEVSYRIEDVASPEDVWTHRDDLGSLTSITDDAGAVLERYEYGDYGLVTIFDTNGDVLPSSQFYAVHLYTGRSLIAGTGLYDYRFRVMDPWSGRFNQRDPLWYIDSMNAYGYVISNPVGYVDPLGLSYWSDFVDGARQVRDFLDGTLFEETEDTANAHARHAANLARKARELGDNCLAMKIFLSGVGSANTIAQDAVAIADDARLLIKSVTVVISTAMPAGGTHKLVKGIRSGREYRIGKNLRIAPYGNRVKKTWAPGSKAFQKPHYHRKIIDKTTGKTKPGGSLKKHRPWEGGW